MACCVKNDGRRVPVTLFTKGGGQWPRKRWRKLGRDAPDLTGPPILPMHVVAWETQGCFTGQHGSFHALYAPTARIEEEVASILSGFGQGKAVFNLGHGIHQDVPPEHAGAFVEAVHRLSAQYHR